MQRLIAAGLLSCAAAAHAEVPNALPKEVEQGQLVVVKTAPGSKVTYAGRSVRVATDGTFAIGIAYDAPKEVRVQMRAPGGKSKVERIAVTQRTYDTERVDGLPPETVTPDAKTARRIRAEAARVEATRQRNDDRTDFARGLKKPPGRVSGVYGSARIDNGQPRAPHLGLDIAAGAGTPIAAPAGGIVTLAETDFVLSGGTVLIDHGHGVSSSFLHLSKIDVKAGDRVERGAKIGEVGATGRATGPHIHWGVSWFGTRLDPALVPSP